MMRDLLKENAELRRALQHAHERERLSRLRGDLLESSNRLAWKLAAGGTSTKAVNTEHGRYLKADDEN